MLTLFWVFNGPILEHRQWIVLSIVLCLKRRWNLLFTANTEEWWRVDLVCIVTTLNLIQQQQQPLKLFKNWNLSFSPTQHTVHSASHLITIFSDRSKMRYVDADLQTMKRSRTWCIYSFAYNRKYSSQAASGNSWTEVINVWRRRGLRRKLQSVCFCVAFAE